MSNKTPSRAYIDAIKEFPDLAPKSDYIIISGQRSNSLFDRDAMEKIISDIENQPPITPSKYEPRYSVTQLFETGAEVTLHWIVRGGTIIYYNAERKFV